MYNKNAEKCVLIQLLLVLYNELIILKRVKVNVNEIKQTFLSTV